MKTSDNIGELSAALAAAQGQMSAALKDAQSKGPTRHKYADLDAVWEACREPLASNGLSVVQGVSSELHTVNGEVWGWLVSVTTTLLHTSGGSVVATLTLPAVEQKGISMAQSIGVASTYARRYGLSAMVGITQEDNDGHVGQRRKPRETVAAKRARTGRHHSSWEKERVGFVLALEERGWKYEDVKARLVAEGKTAPSNWTQSNRARLVAAIDAKEWPKGEL